MKNLGNVLRRHVDFYNTALAAVVANPQAETFSYNDWEFDLANALEDFYKDLKDGKLSVKIEAAS